MKIEYTHEWFAANVHAFEKWFDKHTYDFKNRSNFLTYYCSHVFDKWWDAETFNWNQSDALARYCHNDFNKWWDAKRYNWKIKYYLPTYCIEHLDTWYDSKHFMESKADLQWFQLRLKMGRHFNEN